MRCLPLLLTLFCVVHSFKQIILDYKKCETKEYFCLVPPDIAMKQQDATRIIPLRDEKVKSAPDSGVLIKPLTPHKWLVILHREITNMDIDSGLYLYHFGTVNHNLPVGVIAGCNRHGAVEQDPNIAPLFSFDVIWTSSEFIENKKIVCTGILKTKTETIAAALNALPQQGESITLTTHVWGMVLSRRESIQQPKQLMDGSPSPNLFNFVEVAIAKQCDFNLLLPPDGPLTYTHAITEVETYSEPIDCKDKTRSRVNKEIDDRNNFDLLIKIKGTDAVLEVDTITCDPIGATFELNYNAKGTKTRIDREATVACGERSKCSNMPPAVCEAPECEPPTKVDKTCDSTKEKCEELKCPDDHWFINEKVEIEHGKVMCRKESIEDESSPRWFIKFEKKESSTSKRAYHWPLAKASCLKLYECQENNPIQSTCDGFNHTESCTKATFTRNAVYCPKNHDLMYKEEIDGHENTTESLFCDKKVGQWKLNLTEDGVTIANVYCIFNKERDNMLLGGKSFLKAEENPDLDFWDYYKSNWHIMLTTLLFPIPYFIYLLIKKAIKSRKQKKIDAFLEKTYKKRCERFQESWTTEEKWAVRPYNSHNYRGGTELLLPDLRTLDGKSFCKIMWKEFSLYSPEEKFEFLENCIPLFSTKEKLVCSIMPLLYKCTEHNEKWNNLKQAMHPKLVYVAFKILKLFVNIYSKRGDQESADRIRKVIGIRANNMLSPMGLERAADESKDVTKIRIHGLEAALFAGNEDVETRLLNLWNERGFNASNPIRKFAWAVAVKKDFQLGIMVQKWNEETIKFHENWGKPKDPLEEQWGDTLEHLFYAICAEPEERTLMERVFLQVINKKLFTARHIWSGFQSVMEVFDYNQMTGRIMFREQHSLITKKMSYVGMYFREIWRLIYTYSAFYPGHQGWLLPFAAKTFPDEVRIYLLPEALTYVEIYNGAYKFKTVAAVVEEELSKIKPDAVEEKEKYIALIKLRRKLRKKVKPGWSQRSWVDKKLRKTPKKEGGKDKESKDSASKNTKESKNQSESKASKKPVESMKQGPGGLVEREDNMESKNEKNEEKKPPPPKETPMILE